MAEDPEVQPELVAPPEVMFETRVDDKGRLKFPEQLKRFLETLPDQEFFITTLDLKIAQIYPKAAWYANKKLLSEEKVNPEAAKRLTWVAARFGGEAKMDGQGRVLVPQQLRQKLGIENASVSVMWAGTCVEVYSTAYDEQMLQAVQAWSEEDLSHMRRQGLK